MRRAAVLATVSVALTQLTLQAQDPIKIGTDVVEGAVMIDLAELPPGAALLRAISLSARDAGLQRQLDREMQSWLATVKDQLDTNVRGVLLRVNVFTGEFGNVQIPGGQLLTLVGGGQDEVDAMANYLAHDRIEAPRPRGMLDSSSFIWIRKDRSGLVLTTVPREFRARLTEKAIQLRDARALTKAAQVAFPVGTVRAFAASEYWAALHKATVERVKSEATRARIQSLTARMEQLEREANAVYEQYREAEREMIEVAKRQQMLDTMIAITSLVQGALESNQFSTAEGKTVTAGQSDVPFRDMPAQIEFTRIRVQQTKNGFSSLEERVKVYRNQATTTERDLESAYRGENITLPPRR